LKYKGIVDRTKTCDWFRRLATSYVGLWHRGPYEDAELSIATNAHEATRPQPHRLANCLQPPGRAYRLEALADGDAGRAELEHFVHDRFEARHGANVRSFMPTLLGFRDRAQVLRGVAGVRGAGEGRLYLEQYLDRPIESELAAALRARGLAPVDRERIVEVGNLAGTSCRAAVRMVAHIPAWLMSQRYSWIVFTATNSVRQILAGFGAPLVELAQADAGRVAAARDEWGRYYSTDPRVFAGYLPDAERLAGFVHRGRR
jgi:hypothetical protein